MKGKRPKRKRAAEQIKELEGKRSKIKETAQKKLRDIDRVISEFEMSQK